MFQAQGWKLRGRLIAAVTWEKSSWELRDSPASVGEVHVFVP